MHWVLLPCSGMCVQRAAGLVKAAWQMNHKKTVKNEEKTNMIGLDTRTRNFLHWMSHGISFVDDSIYVLTSRTACGARLLLHGCSRLAFALALGCIGFCCIFHSTKIKMYTLIAKIPFDFFAWTHCTHKRAPVSLRFFLDFLFFS